MKQESNEQKRGAALITVLILASAIAIVVTGLFTIRGRDVEVSGKQVHQMSAVLGEKAAFATATALLEEYTASDDYVVSAILNPTQNGPLRYTYISQPSAASLEHIPLFSGGKFKTLSMPDLVSPTKPQLLAGPLGAPTFELDAATTGTPITTGRISHLSSAGELTFTTA